MAKKNNGAPDDLPAKKYRKNQLEIKMEVSFTPLPEERRRAWEQSLGQFFAILVEGYKPKISEDE